MSLLKRITALKQKSWLFLGTAIIIAALLLSGCSPIAAGTVVQQPQTGVLSPVSPVQATALYDESLTTALYDKCMPAVVQIESVVDLLPRLPMPFGQNVPRQRGQGSGFIIDAQGHILTNNHVVDKASTVKVVLNDGTKLDAKVIGNDRYNDLALLQVDASKMTTTAYLTLADSSKVKPGQMAVALGSPFGLQGSITVGIVSGIGRSITGSASRNITDIIQTDAAINPGNSGGPLLNSRGEVIGINTAIEADGNGVGFAVPINTARSLMPELLKGGSIKTAWLGIEGMPVTKELADKLKLKVEKGVYVVSVIPESPASKAGLLESGRNKQNEPTAGGDIITAIDNMPVTKVDDMLSYFNNKRPGDRIVLSVQRGDQQVSVPVELGEWPEQLSTSDESGQDDGKDGFDFGPFHFRIR